jgi:predicted SprT family Zn-dependent metalloprotease
MTNKTVREIIRETCESNDCPEVVDLVWFEWSNRMTSTMGSVSGGPTKGYRVKLSTKLFARADEEEQRDTVIHEVCHAIDNYLNQRGMTHGEDWKIAMRLAGREPCRLHDVSIEGLVKRFLYTCPDNCHKFKISTRMHNQIAKGQERICVTCKGDLSFSGRIEGNQ